MPGGGISVILKVTRRSAGILQGGDDPRVIVGIIMEELDVIVEGLVTS